MNGDWPLPEAEDRFDLLEPAGRFMGVAARLGAGVCVIAGPPGSGRTTLALDVAAQVAAYGRTVTYVSANPTAHAATLAKASPRTARPSPGPGMVYLTEPADPLIPARIRIQGSVLVLDDADMQFNDGYPHVPLVIKVLIPEVYDDEMALRWNLQPVPGPGETIMQVNLPVPLRGGPHLVDALLWSGMAGPADLPTLPRAELSLTQAPTDLAGAFLSSLSTPGCTILELPSPSLPESPDEHLLRVAASLGLMYATDDRHVGAPISVITDDTDTLTARAAPDWYVTDIHDVLGVETPHTVIPTTAAILDDPERLAVALTRHTQSSVILTHPNTHHPVLDRLRQHGRATRVDSP